MSRPTKTQIVQVEDLLRDLGATLVVRERPADAPARSWVFNSRPVIAACFALFVFAPGCAAAAVFLMRVDGDIPPMVTPDRNPPLVAKTDRLPLGQWSPEAAERLGAKDAARFAAASANEDPAFLMPILIRGSLEEGTITTFIDPPVTPPSVAAIAKPHFKRDVRRSKPPKLVAELTPPMPPQQSFFEKLFGSRLP